MTLPASPSAPQARERLLHRLWQEQRLAFRPLLADDGRAYRTVFPGWPNAQGGPDFRDAIIAAEDGRLLKGDVEVHVHARDWTLHGHHRDPAYRNVALHVAWRGEGQGWQCRNDAGTLIPTVCLEGALSLPLEVVLLAGQWRGEDPRPCVRHGPQDPQMLGRFLEQAGKQRFLAKAAALLGEAAARGPEQALYRGLLDALGYSKNRQPFRELADRVPFATAAGLAAGKSPQDRRRLLLAVFLGASGLLPGAAQGAPGLAALWERCRALGVISTAWQTSHVRPENSPARRVAGAALLVDRFLDRGLLDGLQAAAQSAAASGDCEVLEAALTMEAPSEDAVLPVPGSRTLIGRARAGDMVINVVLPFFYALAEQRGQRTLQQGMLEAYRCHPPLASNQLTRQMERMLLPDGARRTICTAAHQQGLIRLYKSRCAGLLCQGCGLSRPLVRVDGCGALS